ncbi:MAG: phosphoglucosamine mutase [Leptospiraceae bacterium]|nr:phosphoglucosamine mutase [Leptospiraceae bacterium]
MISVSGIRGKIPSGLNFENIIRFTRAFSASIPSKKIVIGRDSRPSGQFFESLVKGVLLGTGKDVISLGITTTPTVKAVVNASKSGGGIMISASHNPIEWNAFKLIGKNGFFFNKEQNDLLMSFYERDELPEPLFKPGSQLEEASEIYFELHLNSVLKRIDEKQVRKRKFTVLVDAVNGGGSFAVPALLRRLGCTVIETNCRPDGSFPRPPEPTPSALKKTAILMKSCGADIGFALDPDADRLVILSPQKGAILEEYTLPLAIQSLSPYNFKQKNVVVNLSTSFVSASILEKYNKKLIRSKVGEANVVEEMIQSKAFFGGEGNGGVIDPEINSFGRDSLSGIAHILNYLSREKLTIDSALSKLPEIHMHKEAFPLGNINLVDGKSRLLESFPGYHLDERDGIHLESADSWVHIRPSNTEPIIRLIAEARTKKDLKNLLLSSKRAIGSL